MTTEINMLLNHLDNETNIVYKMNPDKELEIRRLLNKCINDLGQIYSTNIQQGFLEKDPKCLGGCGKYSPPDFKPTPAVWTCGDCLYKINKSDNEDDI